MTIDPRLVAFVQDGTGLGPDGAARLIHDVLAFHAEPVEQWVRRRHAELKTYGARNADIFPTLRAELDDLVVAAPALSERQLRRIVYG